MFLFAYLFDRTDATGISCSYGTARRENKRCYGYIDASLSGREQQIQDAWAHGFVAGADNTASLQIVNHPELYQSILGIYGYRIQNEATIDALSSICRETCETYILGETWQEGWKKIGSGAFSLMSGAGALGVAFGKTGTLLTVLGLASGGSSVALGTSELLDGICVKFSVKT